MTHDPAFAAWLAQRQAQADAPPLSPRDALWLDVPGAHVGSIEATLGERLLAAGLPLRRSAEGWCVTGAADAALAQIARWMNANALGGRWRDELLAVTDANGHVVSHVERAAVRPLGIMSFAVHLIAHAEQGGTWVQQRALDKATDPGLWDTAMGGLVAGFETVLQALERETWEEAGLRIVELREVNSLGRITIRRPVDAHGYMVENIDVFEATVPAGVVPVNQDGEVLRFERIERAPLRERLVRGEFTLEASLILARGLQV
ncbi:MAG: NUDIX domain-containing protein [Burkholderiales bacterium]|nr:NUDIX domain-containing protein [Burkholderiales bacterium]